MESLKRELEKGMVKDWSKYAPFITFNEMKCKHTGLCYIQEHFIESLMTLRLDYGKPMNFSSGYRWITHPDEVNKSAIGDHPKGVAVDVTCWSDQAFVIAEKAVLHGINVIGVSQSNKSKARFIHLAKRQDIPEGEGVLYSY